MRIVVGLVASLVVNGALVGGFEWTAREAQRPPAGEVLIVQVPDLATSPVYADAAPTGATASRTL